ncbi:MAG: phosphomannomutase/phosphoglucomutase [Clostridia bacterium]|nr:phosphomannomutase/phosphoglucomutase [Clostridia bacterium]
MEIAKHIFRGYDIRGVYGTDLNEEVAYKIGQGFGSYISELGKTKAVVGRDNRIHSESLENALIDGILSTGIDVVNIGLVTTPMYYYSWIHLGIPSGMMVTASHNSKEYNGFKFAFDETGNAYGEKIQEFREYIEKGEFKEGKGTLTHTDIREGYLNLIKERTNFGDRKLKVVVDGGNGAATTIMKDVFSMFENLDVTYICDESDGTFPNHEADPSNPKNLTMLMDKVLELKADIGLAFDGDSDRIGIIDENGECIAPDMYLIALWRSIIDKVENKCVLHDVKCTKAIADEMKKLGGSVCKYRVGNSYIKAKMRDGDFALGGELSGHIFFRDRWPGFDDAIYAGLRYIELLSNNNKSASELLEGVTKYYSTPEIRIKTTETGKYELVEKVKAYAKAKGYETCDIDGIRVEFDDAWMLLRATQTGPEAGMRFEATTEERLKEIMDEFRGVISF